MFFSYYRTRPSWDLSDPNPYQNPQTINTAAVAVAATAAATTTATVVRVLRCYLTVIN